MKRSSVCILCLIVAVTLFAFVGCNSDSETYNNIEASGRVYTVGAQEITLLSVETHEGNPALFETSIQCADIEIGGALQGKTVEKVVFVSATEIKITLTGDVTTAKDNGDGFIRVKHGGLASKGESLCAINVCVPKIETSSISQSGSKTVKTFTTTFVLPWGDWSVELGSITLKDQSNGTLIASVVEGNLFVTVESFDVTIADYPQIVIPCGATPFGREFTVFVGKSGEYPII